MPATGRSFQGAIVATLAAGPVFIIGLGLSTWMADMTQTVPLHAISVAGVMIVPVMIYATVGGAILSFLPNLIGTTVMAWLADRNLGMRLAVAWALVGTLVPGLTIVIADSGKGGTTFAVALIFTGAVCAVISHRMTIGADGPPPLL